jgi:RimJ/RimL family protein N-acetyltransferase
VREILESFLRLERISSSVLSTAPLETARLLLRPPVLEDAPAIFERYASDAEVTRYLGWPRHSSVEDTQAFVVFSQSEWARSSVGPLLVFARDSGRLLGSSGLLLETPHCAQTGYVFSRDAWGHGYATEALGAMVTLAAELKITRLYALCHTEHQASWHVLEKCGFTREGILQGHSLFPNLSPKPLDVFSYGRTLV